MHLLHPHRDRGAALAEADCYHHSYGEHLLDRVELVHREQPAPVPEIRREIETPRHVTTEQLKRQFEERLEARRRRQHKRS